MNNTLTLTKKEFKKVVEVIKYASKEEARPILKAVHFAGNEVVALDGYRIAIRKLNTKLDVNCNIDAKDLKEIMKKLTKEINNIIMIFHENSTTFLLIDEYNNNIYATNVSNVEGNYINYKSIIDVDTFKFNTVASIEFNILHPIKDLISYLKKIDKKERLVKLYINEFLTIGQKTVNDDNLEIEWINNSCFYNECKGDLTIGVNHIYLKNMLENYKNDKESKLLFTGSSSPIFMSNESGCDAVLPMRITH